MWLERNRGAAESRLTRARGGGHLKRPAGTAVSIIPLFPFYSKAASTSSTLDAMSRRSALHGAGELLWVSCIVLLLGTPTSSSAGSLYLAPGGGGDIVMILSGRYVIAGIRAMVRVGNELVILSGAKFGP